MYQGRPFFRSIDPLLSRELEPDASLLAQMRGYFGELPNNRPRGRQSVGFVLRVPDQGYKMNSRCYVPNFVMGSSVVALRARFFAYLPVVGDPL